MKILKTASFFATHGAIVVSIMMITFAIINTMNNSMEFLIGSMTRKLMLVWIFFILAVSALEFLKAKAKWHRITAIVLAVCDAVFTAMWIYNKGHIDEHFFDLQFSGVFIMALATFTIFASGVLIYLRRHEDE